MIHNKNKAKGKNEVTRSGLSVVSLILFIFLFKANAWAHLCHLLIGQILHKNKKVTRKDMSEVTLNSDSLEIIHIINECCGSFFQDYLNSVPIFLWVL